MIAKRPHVAVLLSVVITLGTPLSTLSLARQGRDCGQIADRFNRQTKAFTDEANRNNMSFIASDVLSGPIEDVTELLKGNATVSNALEVKASMDKIEAARGKMRSYEQVLKELKACIDARGKCSLLEFSKQVSAEMKEWIESLTEAGLTAASQRVEQAQELMTNYLERTMDITTGTMNEMAACTSDFNRRAANVSVETTPAAPASPAEPAMPEVAAPEPGKVAVPDEGGSDMLMWTALIGGTAAAGYYKYGQGGKDCGAQPSLDYDFRVQSRPSDSQINAMRAYCSCQGKTYGTGSAGTGCL